MGKPKIRFKGYEDAWEQRKLEEYLGVSKEKNRDESFGKDDVLSVSGEYGIVNQIEFQGRSFAGASVANYGVVEGGDVVYTKSPLKSNPYGIIKTNKGKTGIVSTLYAVYKPKNNVGAEFVQIYFELDSRMNSYMHPLVNKGAKNDMKVSDENALKGSVIFPKIDEQKAISKYFAHLDHLITLHQRKCEETKSLKKYMLQKMFPENGKCVPEIRFSGFSDAWEQRKFGEIVEKYEDLVETPTEGYTRLGIRSHAKGTFHSFVEKGKELETAKMFRVAADKFIVNITFGWEHAVAITDENDAGKLVSHRFPQYSFNAGMVPKFFRYLILDENFKHHLELSSPGGAGRNRVLKLNDMLEYKMNFPSEVEQGKIAAYFDHLDHLITLHQRKCYRFIDIALDAWEQRKVSELLQERNEQAPMSEEYPLMAFIANQGVAPKGDRYDRSALVNDETGKKYKRTEFGDFIYSSNNLETGSIGLNKYGNACISPVYSIFKPTGKADLDFLGRRFLRKDFINEMVKWRQGVVYGQWKIHETDFLNIVVTVPTIEEQKRIGDFLDGLDSLITLHQHKCDELQKLKKFMLQNMFV